MKKKQRKASGKSLQFHIFLLSFLISLIPSVLISTGLYFFMERQQVNSFIISIESQAQLINNSIVTSGYLTDQSSETVDQSIDSLAVANSGRILVTDSSMRVLKDTYEIEQGTTIVWDNAIAAAGGQTVADYNSFSHFLSITVPITDDDLTTSDGTASSSDSSVQGVLIFLRTTEDLYLPLSTFISYLIVIFLVDGMIVFLIAWLVSRRQTRPVRQIAFDIADIQKGIHDEELAVNDYRETREISRRFNSYTEQMRKINDSRNEFVSNVSHELKTPLTSMKVLADSINSMGGDAPIEMYREFMEDIGGEIDRETKIINDLLSLVRLDRTNPVMDVSPVNMNELVEEILKRLRPIAEKQQVELVLESFRPITVEIDETKFSLAITNLVENAIKYNNPGGYVHVSLNADHQYCYLHVEDNGLGIPEEALDHIFERFYRADKSHSRQIGGTGLGLAITYNVIMLHKGDIRVQSKLGEGSHFFVRVPLNYIESGVNV